MTLIIKYLGLTEYQKSWDAMKNHIEKQPNTDELWVTEHPSIYTTGLNKKDHVLPNNDIPHLFVDRGGKITYHGPGQLIIYTLINLKKNNLTIRQLISILEESVISFLSNHKIDASSKKDAPGVYVNKKKIASIGLRIKKDYTYHGLSFNINMNLKPFLEINPCGFNDLKMAQLADLNIKSDLKDTAKLILPIIQKKFKQHYEKHTKQN